MDRSSKAICPLTLYGCLEAAEEFIGTPLPWEAINDQQAQFLARSPGKTPLPFSPEEYARIASTKEADLNKFFSDRGFTLTVPPIPEGGFGSGCTLNILVEWQEKANLVTITTKAEKSYEGISFPLNQGHTQVQMIAPPFHNHRIATLPAKRDGDFVFITPYSGPIDDESILVFAEKVLEGGYQLDPKAELQLPMLNYDQTGPLDWLTGLRRSDNWFVASAVQQNRFKLNEIGARAESAAAMTFLRSAMVMRPNPLIIDEPFLIWIARDGVRKPIFTLFAAEDCWANPGSLG
jgi:hypothetical protein